MERLHVLQPLFIPGLILGGFLVLTYSGAFAIAWRSRTLGRRMMGVHLVDRTGAPPTPLRTILRTFLSTVSFAFFLGGIWLALFDRKGQTLHDKLTATYLVRMP